MQALHLNLFYKIFIKIISPRLADNEHKILLQQISGWPRVTCAIEDKFLISMEHGESRKSGEFGGSIREHPATVWNLCLDINEILHTGTLYKSKLDQRR